jgi:hypothetical protein
LGILLALLGFDASMPIYPKIGGVKAHGYGTIETHLEALRVISADDYRQYEPTTSNPQNVAQLISRARQWSEFRPDPYAELGRVLGERPEEV